MPDRDLTPPPTDALEAALSSLAPRPPSPASAVRAAYEAGRRAGLAEAASEVSAVGMGKVAADQRAAVRTPPDCGPLVRSYPRLADDERDRRSLRAWRVAAGVLLATSLGLLAALADRRGPTDPVGTPAVAPLASSVPVLPPAAPASDRHRRSRPTLPAALPAVAASPGGGSYLALRAAVLERGLSALDDAADRPRSPSPRRPAPPVAGWGAGWADGLAAGAS